MVKWLSELNTAHSSTMYKPELYAFIKAYKPTYKMTYMELEQRINKMTEQIVVRLGKDTDSDKSEEENGSDEDKEPNVDTSDSGKDDFMEIVPFDCY
ncbi:hypothetical protein J6590_090166 [Homalodisca vitripennis]|nr:hypothetical protein J6590_090166 [Homalodisca vitripennis]